MNFNKLISIDNNLSASNQKCRCSNTHTWIMQTIFTRKTNTVRKNTHSNTFISIAFNICHSCFHSLNKWRSHTIHQLTRIKIKTIKGNRSAMTFFWHSLVSFSVDFLSMLFFHIFFFNFTLLHIYFRFLNFPYFFLK